MEGIQKEILILKEQLEDARIQLEQHDNNPHKVYSLGAIIESLMKRVSNLQILEGMYEELDARAE